MSFDVYQAQGLRIFQGNDEQVSNYVGREGELAINMETKAIHILDGVTPGGLPTSDTGGGVLAGSNTFEAANRAAVTTANDGVFDLDATNNFECAPFTPITLSFSNIGNANGQGGNIWLDNSNNQVISAGPNTKINPMALSTISAGGKYWMSYYCNGVDVMVTSTGDMS